MAICSSKSGSNFISQGGHLKFHIIYLLYLMKACELTL
jgi:hypothetical protein